MRWKAISAAMGVLLGLLGATIPANPVSAAVAPNGLIAFSALDENGFERIFTVKPDGTERTNITAGQAGQQSAPVWSPDGSRILYNSSAADSGGYSTDADVWVMDADGGNPALVTPTPDPDINWYDNHPSWSPDGTQFVWGTNREGGDEDIYRANIDGTNPVPAIIDEPFLDVGTERFYGIERFPAWSPDGSRIAFFETGLTGNYLSLIDASGIGPIATVADPRADAAQGYRDISWSPDGTRLLFLESFGLFDPAVMVADLSTGEFFDLTPVGYADFATPTFSPDGTQIVLSAYSFDTGENGLLSIPNPPAAAAAGTRALAAPTSFLPGTTGALTSDWAPGSPPPACTITGTDGSNRLTGTPGDDVICGLGGNDLIDGAGGNDIVLAGPGNDIVVGGTGNDTLDGQEGNDLVTGGSGDDGLVGGVGRDLLLGGTGADTLAGGDDADILNGIDRVSGNDQLDGGGARDVCLADRGDGITAC